MEHLSRAWHTEAMKYRADDLEVKINGRGGSGKAAIWQWNLWVKGAGGARLAQGTESGARDKAEKAGERAKSGFVDSAKS